MTESRFDFMVAFFAGWAVGSQRDWLTGLLSMLLVVTVGAIVFEVCREIGWIKEGVR